MAIQQMHTYCAMCVSRCGVLATVEDGRLMKVTADPAHPNGCICVKGTAAPEIVYAPDRLPYPLRRTRPKGDPNPGWTRLSWDEALDLTASRLLAIKDHYGPEAVVFPVATSAGTAANDFAFSGRGAGAAAPPTGCRGPAGRLRRPCGAGLGAGRVRPRRGVCAACGVAVAAPARGAAGAAVPGPRAETGPAAP
jgi:anaerobic selenocysteine-containing dehydrogenase